jgi:transposase
MIKAALSNLNFHSLLDCDGRISERLSRQKVKTHLHRIKIENHEERCVVKFLFLQGKRSQVIHAELSEVHGEAAVSLATVKRWCWRFKEGNFSLDDEFRSGRPRDDIREAISQFVNKKRSLLQRFSQRSLY